MAAALGTALGPDAAAELPQLRALARRQAQELEILKKIHHHLLADAAPMNRYRFIAAERGYYDAQASVVGYFDYYNHQRLHSSIGYQVPYHTHHQLLQTTAPNCPA